MKIPLHVRARKSINNLINKTLSSLNNATASGEFIDKNEIKSVIIVRPNYRIGNLIFLTPLINELCERLPNAKIDLIVGMKIAGDVLRPLPNVDKVISVPRELLRRPMQLYDFIKETRKKKYDLAINVMGASTSSQMVTSLLSAKYKASFYNEKSWGKLTHTTPYEGTYKHIGLQSLELLKLFNVSPPIENLKLDVKLTDDETKKAKEDLKAVLKGRDLNADSKVVSVFRNARFDKKIVDEWWSEWLDELLALNENVIVVDILSPDVPSKLNDKVLEYSNKNLRILGAFFKECDLYVSADTGPMHLAAASDAKVLALFNKTNIEAFGALGDKSKTIDVNDLSPKEVAKITMDFL